MAVDDKPQVVKNVVASAKYEAKYEGPIPPPAWMREYEDVLPGLANRIFSEVETESAHRRDLEQQSLSLAARVVRRGQIGAWLIGVAILVVVTVLVIEGHSIVGAVLGVTEILGIVISFIAKHRTMTETPTDDSTELTG